MSEAVKERTWFVRLDCIETNKINNLHKICKLCID